MLFNEKTAHFDLHRARAGLLGVMTLSPEKLVESMKNLLMKNSLHIFREVTLKRLEQLELEILGLPELQRIVCYFYTL